MQTVEQVMSHSVLTVSPETPIGDVARILVDKGISGLPVVDADNRVVGVVSEGDLVVKEAGIRPPVSRRPLARHRDADAINSKVHARTAGEAMTSPAITIEPFRALRTAAEIMTERGVNRLPVVGSDGELLGIITRADLVRAFVRSDDELTETIRGEVLIREMWLDPDQFTVRVDHGTAYVEGAVQKRSTAEVIARLLAMVPGIVAAETTITWTEDDGGVTTP
jgi:CBS domain-containing protein